MTFVFMLAIAGLILAALAWAPRARAEEGPRGFDVEAGPGPHPWTHLKPLDDPRDFHFAILADRSGGIRDGRLEHIIDRVNLMRPTFVLHIGDLIEGAPDDMNEVHAQWDEALELIRPIEAPLFLVPGNHDVNNLAQIDVWKERLGELYYHFVYQDVLFLVLHTEDPPGKQMSDAQVAYVAETLARYPDARWTFVFLHVPLWLYSHEHNWEKVEALLHGRKHTVFAGHMHEYVKHERNGGSYIILASSGAWNLMRGPAYGEFDHVTWVSVSDSGPRILNVDADGLLNENVHTAEMYAELAPVRRGAVVTSRGVFCDGPEFRSGTARLRLFNPLGRSLRVTALIHPTRQAQPSVTRIERELAPGEEVFEDVALVSSAPAFARDVDPVRVTWRVECNYPDREPVVMTGAHRIVIEATHACPRRDFATKLDARLDAWPALAWRCLEPAQVTQCPEDWVGPADASFDFGVAYDEDYVYVAVRVRDDVPKFRARKDPWRKDSVMIRLDARPEAERAPNYRPYVNPGMHDELARHFGTYPGGGAFDEYLFIGLSVGAAPDEYTLYEAHRLPQGLRCACIPAEGGYQAEIAVPVAYLNERQGGDWRSFRLNVSVFDFDDSYAAPHKAIWWRPEWNSPEDFEGSGTFRRA